MTITNYRATLFTIAIASISIAALALPIIKAPFFMQNDDWIYYLNIQSFLNGNFLLHDLTAPTFYTQGLDAYFFALLFGIENLPILTVIVSTLTIVILILILITTISLSTATSILLSLILMFTPLFVYSMTGFMTDNYFLMWIAILYLCLFLYDKSGAKNKKLLATIIIVESLAFYLRQVAVIFIVASVIWFAINKKWNAVKAQILMTAILLFSYYFLFPQTPEMAEKSIEISNYFDFKSIGLLRFSIATATGAFLAPLIIFSAIARFVKNKRYLIALGISIIIFGVVYLIIKNPHLVLIEGFPHMANTLDRKGFFLGGLAGNKYHFKGYFDLFNFWAITGIISGIIFASIFIYDLIFKNLNNAKQLLLLSILGYLALLIGSPAIYDRYILPILFFGIIYLAQDFYDIKGKYMKALGTLLTIGFLSFTFIISYSFLVDYISWNSYVWGKSQDLIKQGVPAKKILGTNAHNKLYNTSGQDWEYFFTFDKPNVLDKTNLTLHKEQKLEGVPPIFIDPIIYLYKKDELIEKLANSPY